MSKSITAHNAGEVLHPTHAMANLSQRTIALHQEQIAIESDNIRNGIALGYRSGNVDVISVKEDIKTTQESGPEPFLLAGVEEKDYDEPQVRILEYKHNRFSQFLRSITDAILIIMANEEIDEAHENEFRTSIIDCTREFKKRALLSALPDKPTRDYIPGEGILNYLRSKDGFGPWVAAGPGALTRPLIREKAPKAYTALANWLRTNALPDDLPIPTKSEALDAEAVNPMTLREARRVARRSHGRAVSPS